MGDSFMDLVVWQRAVELSTEVYRLTSSFPKSELFGLVSQMRRASVSVASNIAEGYGRSTKGEYLQIPRLREGIEMRVADAASHREFARFWRGSRIPANRNALR
jgi:hypothetical protein